MGRAGNNQPARTGPLCLVAPGVDIRSSFSGTGTEAEEFVQWIAYQVAVAGIAS